MKYLFLFLISFNCFSMSDLSLKDCIDNYVTTTQAINTQLQLCNVEEFQVELAGEFKCKKIQSAVRIRNKRKGLTGSAKLQFLNKVKDIAAAINSCSLDSAKILASQVVVDSVITQEDKDALVGFLQ